MNVPAGSEAAFRQEKLMCQVCMSPLSLLLQVHAPSSKEQAGRSVASRSLCLLGCVAAACGTAPGSWRAFRFLTEGENQSPAAATRQLPTEQPQAIAAAAPDRPAAIALPSDSSTAFGSATSSGFAFGAGDFGFDSQSRSGDGGASCDPLSFADLDAALGTIGSAADSRSAASATRGPQPAGSSSSSTQPASAPLAHPPAGPAAEAAVRLQHGGPPLPEFYLSWRDEPGAAPDQLRATDAAHIASLVDQYQADHDMPEAPDEGWGGEAYEADVLPGGDATFPKFSKRLQRAPQQCVRYSFGGTPLWPFPQQPQAPPCEACGAPRMFELQAMPALHVALSEGLAWRRETSGEGDNACGVSIDAWHWLTVAVFTCSKSCRAASGCTVIEEHVVLANE